MVIACSGLGSTKDFTCAISDIIIDLNCLDAGSQCFPLYYYEEAPKGKQTNLYVTEVDGYIRRSGLSPHIMSEAKKLYGAVSEEDVFYYVYGVLHSPSYRQAYAADLKRTLPHLPLLPKEQFKAFSKAGKTLAELHLNYENHKPLSSVEVIGDNGDYTVQKMRYSSKDDKSIILYNSSISIENIPAEAYRYIVNGRPAIEWIMERYQVKTDSDSGITNNPNLWAEEQQKPRYILDLLLSVITLSVKSMEIIDVLPAVEWE